MIIIQKLILLFSAKKSTTRIFFYPFKSNYFLFSTLSNDTTYTRTGYVSINGTIFRVRIVSWVWEVFSIFSCWEARRRRWWINNIYLKDIPMELKFMVIAKVIGLRIFKYLLYWEKKSVQWRRWFISSQYASGTWSFESGGWLIKMAGPRKR